MEWAILFLILFVLVIGLSISLINLKIQIYRITTQLQNILNTKEDKQLVTISLGDRNLEKLAEVLNQIVMRENDYFIRIKCREDSLKENISCLSHDLRTPLTSIRGYLQLLEDAPENKKNEYIDALQKKAFRLERLIDDFYQISLLDEGRYIFEYEIIDISSLLTEILLENYSLFTDKNVTPVISIPEQILYIYTDKTACVRIIQNLLFNALSETVGEISISLLETDDSVKLSVENSISDFQIEDTTKLFDRFYTGNSARNNGNSGQGLYIVKKLLLQMGCTSPSIFVTNNLFTISVKFKKVT